MISEGLWWMVWWLLPCFCDRI